MFAGKFPAGAIAFQSRWIRSEEIDSGAVGLFAASLAFAPNSALRTVERRPFLWRRQSTARLDRGFISRKRFNLIDIPWGHPSKKQSLSRLQIALANASSIGQGLKSRYGEAEREVLKEIWLAAEQPCGKRLKPALPLWLPHYEAEHGALDSRVRTKVLAVSPAAIDRLLKPCRVALGHKGRCGTRPGTLLRKEIPVRTEHWDVAGPGWVEADTVAHCGGSMEGDFCWSLTVTDVHTQWTEIRAIWNKGQHAVRQRIAEIEMALAFPILGFDSDNGGEFLNWHLADYFLKRPKPVHFTRSRPYRKNDNARVEQKNWTHVRQIVGYDRLDKPIQAELLNELYAKEWSQFRNFFCPAMKHLRTEVEGSRKKRIYDKPLTPFERLKACPGVDRKQIERRIDSN